jgi:hypothetical protein
VPKFPFIPFVGIQFPDSISQKLRFVAEDFIVSQFRQNYSDSMPNIHRVRPHVIQASSFSHARPAATDGDLHNHITPQNARASFDVVTVIPPD